jgi:hypothetical protein
MGNEPLVAGGCTGGGFPEGGCDVGLGIGDGDECGVGRGGVGFDVGDGFTVPLEPHQASTSPAYSLSLSTARSVHSDALTVAGVPK